MQPRYRQCPRGVVRSLVASAILSVLVTGPLAPPPPALADASSALADTNAPAGPSGEPGAYSPTPLFAFYYIWFDPSSWQRAKVDYPRLGRYSSDDAQVMRQQVAWAKSAGIDGFIVSWKDTQTNDRRLRLLMDVARAQDFKLAMIYQGLDFSRKPLPVDKVAGDFATFRDEYADDPVFFRVSGKPLTIWSGTWAYSHADVARVTGAVRDSLLVLNTEKNVTDYRRVADVTDGNAYYWSSVNPDTNRQYGTKLIEMSRAIHQDGKYWIAPFAPGFDARLVGGKSVVDRKDGQTLRTEFATAMRSSPDALGLISWNEFSENSHVEPSEKYAGRYLDVLRELRRTPGVTPSMAADSSEEPGTAATVRPAAAYWPGALAVGFPVVLVIGVGLLAARRRRRSTPAPAGSPGPASPLLEKS